MNYIELKEAILKISRDKYHYLLNIQNVVGVGFGTKQINGKNTFEPCIHVLVNKKVSSQYIHYRNCIPKTYMGIKTDVIEVGTFYAKGLTERIRPIQGGYAVSVDGATKNTGTIGCVVTKSGIFGKKYFILSNNHVLAGNNEFKLGSKVVQPAAEDGGVYSKDYIGTLEDYIVINFKSAISSPVNYMDAAIAKLNSKSLVDKHNLIAKVGSVKGVAAAIENQKIKMVGSTTGLSEGFVATIGATTKEVIYPDGKKAFFKNQNLAALKNAGGDSGSIILNQSNEAIGLFFAGSGPKVAIFTDMKLVLNALKVDMYLG